MAGSKDADALVNSIDPKLRGPANKVRAIVKKTLPGAVETVKWGNPVYVLNGKNFAMIMLSYSDHVNLGFWAGAKMKSKLLEGTGKGMRHIKVWKEGDVKDKEFSEIIREAAKLT